MTTIALRCEITGNLCGTDTRMFGRPCQCQGCRAAAEIERQVAHSNQLAKENIELCVKLRDSQAEIERLRTGQMLSLQELRAWREADHEDAITLHRNCVIKVLDEIERLWREKNARRP